jgi:tetratricopeptide (TPR) repeat protein
MAGTVARGKALPAVVLEEVVKKTDGVPLFVEELTKSLLESGLLAEGAQRYERADPLPALAIPATLRDSLMARLDRLGPAKGVAQIASVLGREFPFELLDAVASEDAETLEGALQRLVGAELLYRRGTPPRASYTFKHALIQTTAYESLLRRVRQEVHARAARVLEERFPEQAAATPELLGYHHEAAGNPGEAIARYQAAGALASRRSANAEAVGHFRKALELLETLPDNPGRDQQEGLLRHGLLIALIALRGYGSPELEPELARTRELARRLGETPLARIVLLALSVFSTLRGQTAVGYELAEQALGLAASSGDEAGRMYAHLLMALPAFFRGEFQRSLAHSEQSIALYDPERHRALTSVYGQDAGIVARTYAAWVSWRLGRPERAVALAHEAVALARANAEPEVVAIALAQSAILYLFLRDTETAGALAEEAVAISSEQEFPLYLGMGRCTASWVGACVEGAEEFLQGIREGLAVLHSTGTAVGEPFGLMFLADACRCMGRPQEGLEAIERGLELSEGGVNAFVADLHCIRGELLLATGSDGDREAEECFQRSLELARGSESKSLELRAAISLARLWQRQGKRTEAHDLLQPLYDWFTEGFDTQDLKGATALLEELA